MSESGTIEAELILIDRYRETGASSTHSSNSSHSPHASHSPSTPPASSLDSALNRSASPLSYPTGAVTDNDLDERSRVISALEQAGWVQARAARILGMTPRQIAYRILTLNIEVKKI
jgi:Nif-specific regulatory protein